MKRILFALALTLLPVAAFAQQPPFAIVAAGCAGTLNYGNMPVCYDTTNNAFYYWNGTTYTAINASGTITSPLVLNGTSSGHINLSSGATPTAYTLTLKSTVPAQGDLVTYSNGTGQMASIADVATGSVLVSGGTSTVPAYSSTPSVSTVTATGTGDLAINASQGGHISSLLGSGTAPTVTTCGTGSIAATSTDTAGDVTATGATACTVVFNTAFSHKPVCVATDESTAAGLKLVYGGTGNAAQITVSGLTSGDEFTYVCIGK